MRRNMLRRYISWKQGLIEGQRRARHIVSLLKEPNGASSVDDFEAVFFDDGIGEHFFGNALQLFLSFVAVPAIEIQDEEFALADIFHEIGRASCRERGYSSGVDV